ncbi:replication-associated recombination protein A [Mycoplasmopsis alligatoris]|uniref:Recombination factor protein RarA n=1 Tax=Mycoplasmopsis alligatoris A21JP2 TaxID=747682 RepID=D4XVX9_9BACT|nr:replication-associated recombination protein A [Mycoplasmopsis alligatoris]EFF41496.1 recombination factor protein RarA [Mycoplasmopsis alligatoris A21JP2]
MKNLANELRPKKLSDIVGQKHVVELLQKIALNKVKMSFIFFGESGIGKTSAAFALANQMKLKTSFFNASIDNKSDLVEKLANSEIIIIDEIHRLNKDKQDILLSYLEFDKIIIYATTTENPYFRVNPALRSRMQIVSFNKLSEEEIAQGLLLIKEKHFPKLNISKETLFELSTYGAGDFRSCINNLQMLGLLCKDQKEVNKDDLKKIIPNISFYSDSNSSAHYNNLSAFHKSLRGSDVNAALYYGFLILKTGDYQGLIRRINCVAYEDIGLANPNITLRLEAAINSVERLGFPEANLALGFIIIDLALSPKSNSAYQAISRVQNDIEKGKIYEVPKHLKDAHYASATKLGDGLNYKYPHDYEFNWIEQEYLPKQLKNQEYFIFGSTENEKKLKNYWTSLKNFYKGEKHD